MWDLLNPGLNASTELSQRMKEKAEDFDKSVNSLTVSLEVYGKSIEAYGKSVEAYGKSVEASGKNIEWGMIALALAGVVSAAILAIAGLLGAAIVAC